ncbi:MAG TPA: pitrilysin family protein [Anaerolineaceae bacterium]|nr:pitrilysin family protein [Anaerolineaceae bacterium]
MNRPAVIHQTIPGPADITRQVLPNGIVLLTRSNFNSSSVVVSGYLAAGSQLDPLEKLGLAHFSALSLMRGTAGSDFQSLYDRLESAGASLGFGASVHTTSFSGRALAEDLPLLFTTLAECLAQPVFPPEQVKRLRAQLLTGLAIRAQSTRDMAALEFDSLLFPNHPYGRPEDGYTETINSISREDLADFHRRYYGPAGMKLVVVGSVSANQVFDLAESCFASWTSDISVPNQVPKTVIPPQQKITRKIIIPGKSQSDLVMGTLGPKRKDPEYLAASLGNSILGQFGLMGRVGDAVREKAGLAYYASTSLNAWIESGSWEVSAGVNPGNVEKAAALITHELRKFTTEPVTQEELEDNQNNYIGRMPLSLESNSGVANSILNLERFDLGLDYLQRYPSLIRAVTREDILHAALKFIDPEKLIIVSAGPDGKENRKQ